MKYTLSQFLDNIEQVPTKYYKYIYLQIILLPQSGVLALDKNYIISESIKKKSNNSNTKNHIIKFTLENKIYNINFYLTESETVSIQSFLVADIIN